MSKRIQLVVLDDDPTGIQTVHGCYLITQWDQQTLREVFADTHNFFYVLTNTRARQRAEVERTIESIVRNVLSVNRRFGYELVFMSRSDSTLRSHFPLEIDTIVSAAAECGQPMPDAFFLVPAFIEGGRVTVDDIHYILDGEQRVETCKTEFARDSVFGYSSSHLPSYIEEKSAGRIKAGQVLSIPLDMLRADPPKRLADFLAQLSAGRWVVVNAEDYRDLASFAEACLSATQKGKRFAFQCAASIVKALSGIGDKPLLTGELVGTSGPGVFIVGSYVHKTTAQLDRLLAADGVEGIEIDVEGFLDAPDLMQQHTLARMRSALSAGKSPVVYTSRREVQFDSARRRLAAGRKLSLFLASLVEQLDRPVSYIVAKGGITSHDVLVAGLGVTKARVMGQILPGVPVVRLQAGGPLGEIPYVIFPGNVGTEHSLREVLNTLTAG